MVDLLQMLRRPDAQAKTVPTLTLSHVCNLPGHPLTRRWKGVDGDTNSFKGPGTDGLKRRMWTVEDPVVLGVRGLAAEGTGGHQPGQPRVIIVIIKAYPVGIL